MWYRWTRRSQAINCHSLPKIREIYGCLREWKSHFSCSVCSLSAAASDSRSMLACNCLLSRAAGFGHIAVIGLMAVNHSNLTNGFQRMGELLSVLMCAPFQYAGTLRGWANGLIARDGHNQVYNWWGGSHIYVFLKNVNKLKIRNNETDLLTGFIKECIFNIFSTVYWGGQIAIFSIWGGGGRDPHPKECVGTPIPLSELPACKFPVTPGSLLCVSPTTGCK